MYCISTPNLNSPYAGYNADDQKKIENQHVVASSSSQYYYNTNTTVASNPTVQMFSNANIQTSPSIFEVNLTRNQNRFYEEEGRNFECSVVCQKYT